VAGDPIGTDLQLTRRSFDRLVSDREIVDLIASTSGDVQTVSGRANLGQAIVNRLFTRKGALAPLGHPNYGSRLYQLVGEPNNARVRGLAELFIRESLAQEPRVEAITSITFAALRRGFTRNFLEVAISVKPVGEAAELTFVIPLNLEG
jgi:phage baseplate assembly protein W